MTEEERKELEKLRKDNEDYQRSFELFHRGTQALHATYPHPDELTWRDLGEMCRMAAEEIRLSREAITKLSQLLGKVSAGNITSIIHEMIDVLKPVSNERIAAYLEYAGGVLMAKSGGDALKVLGVRTSPYEAAQLDVPPEEKRNVVRLCSSAHEMYNNAEYVGGSKPTEAGKLAPTGAIRPAWKPHPGWVQKGEYWFLYLKSDAERHDAYIYETSAYHNEKVWTGTIEGHSIDFQVPTREDAMREVESVLK